MSGALATRCKVTFKYHQMPMCEYDQSYVKAISYSDEFESWLLQ